MPFYVSPEQVMKDRADYARKGIARGRALVAVEFLEGVVMVGENPSRTLFKTSEIYDRIAFAAVGKYNEFETLKIAGVRHADLKGYAYSRDDVTARSLANAYAQTLGNVFTHEMKPYEVELLVAAVGRTDDEGNELFHILYDGTVMDERRFSVLGGEAEAIGVALEGSYQDGLDRDAAIRIGVQALGTPEGRTIPAEQLEVAVLDRRLGRRVFERVRGAALATALGRSYPLRTSRSCAWEATVTTYIATAGRSAGCSGRWASTSA